MTLEILSGLSAMVGFVFATVGLVEPSNKAFWIGMALMMPEAFNELMRM